MDIDLLRTFLEVHRTRHFGQAAENLFVTQSAVSARIKQLEEILGVRLFTRSRGNIQLTPAGQRFLAYAERLVITWNRARRDVAAEREEAVLLAVAGAPGLWDAALRAWLEWMGEGFPGVTLHADALCTEEILRRLLDGDLDLGFVLEAPQLAGLEAALVMRLPLVMVASRPGLSVQEATAEGYVLVDWGGAFGLSHAQQYPQPPRPRLHLKPELGRLARDYLMTRGGAAYLPEPMVARDLAQKRLFRVCDAAVIDRAVYAVYSQGSDRGELIRRSLAFFETADAA